MRIQSISRNVSFGDLRGIHCDKKFNDQCHARGHELIIKDLYESKAFEELEKNMIMT